MLMEAEVGAMCLQAKELQGLLGGGMEHTAPQSLQVTPCRRLMHPPLLPLF